MTHTLTTRRMSRTGIQPPTDGILLEGHNVLSLSAADHFEDSLKDRKKAAVNGNTPNVFSAVKKV